MLSVSVQQRATTLNFSYENIDMQLLHLPYAVYFKCDMVGYNSVLVYCTMSNTIKKVAFIEKINVYSLKNFTIYFALRDL